jgi:hypothetical protein
MSTEGAICASANRSVYLIDKYCALHRQRCTRFRPVLRSHPGGG